MKSLILLLTVLVVESTLKSIEFRKASKYNIRTMSVNGRSYCRFNRRGFIGKPFEIRTYGLSRMKCSGTLSRGLIAITVPNDFSSDEMLRVHQEDSTIFEVKGNKHYETCIIFSAPVTLEYITDFSSGERKEIKVDQISSHYCKRIPLRKCTCIGFTPIAKYYYSDKGYTDENSIRKETASSILPAGKINSGSKLTDGASVGSKLPGSASAGRKFFDGTLIGILIACLAAISAILSAAFFATSKCKVNVGHANDSIPKFSKNATKVENIYDATIGGELPEPPLKVQF